MVYSSDRDGIPLKKQKTKKMWTKELTLTVHLIPFTTHLSSHHSRTLADKSTTGASEPMSIAVKWRNDMEDSGTISQAELHFKSYFAVGLASL
jgi:hypothetical protein